MFYLRVNETPGVIQNHLYVVSIFLSPPNWI